MIIDLGDKKTNDTVAGLFWRYNGKFNGQQIDDIIQRMNLEIVQRMKTYDPTKGSIITYIYPIVRYAAYFIYRDEVKHSENTTHCDIPEQVIEPSESFLEMIEILDARQKLVVTMYLIQGYNYREIGEKLGLTRQRIAQIYATAIELLEATL